MTQDETNYLQALEFAKNKNEQFKHEELREYLKHIPDGEFENLWKGIRLMNLIEGGTTWFNISQKGELELSRLQGQKETEERFEILSANNIKHEDDINLQKNMSEDINKQTLILNALIAFGTLTAAGYYISDMYIRTHHELFQCLSIFYVLITFCLIIGAALYIRTTKTLKKNKSQTNKQ